MTPFKGQGANQALSDSALLARHVADALLAEAAEEGVAAAAAAHAAHAANGARTDGGTGAAVGKVAARREARVATALAVYEREMGRRAEAKVVASREAAGLYHSAAALETSAYGVAGVPAEAQPALLAALRARRIGADCAAELEPRALAVAQELRAVVCGSRGGGEIE